MKKASLDAYKLLMHPIRLRILQTCMLLKEVTTSQLAGELSDVSQATLYRHVKTLESAGFIQVVKENKIRGTVEKVYSIKEDHINDGESLETIIQILDIGLLNIMGAFHNYIKQEDADFKKDMYFMGTSTLMLSDDEMAQFTEKIGELINEMIRNKADGQRKPRRITFISSPCEEE